MRAKSALIVVATLCMSFGPPAGKIKLKAAPPGPLVGYVEWMIQFKQKEKGGVGELAQCFARDPAVDRLWTRAEIANYLNDMGCEGLDKKDYGPFAALRLSWEQWKTDQNAYRIGAVSIR